MTEALAWETKRREAVERMAVEAFKHRRELEAKLAKNQEAEKALQREIEAPDRAKRRGELEAELAQNKQTQAQLRQELAESQKQLRAEQQSYLAEQSKLGAKTEACSRRRPTSARGPNGCPKHSAGAQSRKALNQSDRRTDQGRQRRRTYCTGPAADGAGRRKPSVGQVRAAGRRDWKRRSELEAQLGQLRQELETAKTAPRTKENSGTERSGWNHGLGLQAAQAEVEQRSGG